MTYNEVLEKYTVEKENNLFRYIVKDKESNKTIGYINGMEVLNDNRGTVEAKIHTY